MSEGTTVKQLRTWLSAVPDDATISIRVVGGTDGTGGNPYTIAEAWYWKDQNSYVLEIEP